MNVLIAGGGTGGHIYPGLAIAEALIKAQPDISIHFIGTEKGAEARIIPAHNFPLHLIELSGFSRSDWKKNIGFPIRLIKGLLQSLKVLKTIDPTVVIATGGYVAGPVTRLAQWQKRLTVVHEQNAVPGFTTKQLTKHANLICLTYPESEKFLKSNKAGKVIVTGNPVRGKIAPLDAATAKQKFGFQPTDKVIAAIGGSTGARSINRVLETLFTRWVDLGFRIIWQSGKTDHELQPLTEEVNKFVVRQPYFDEVWDVYAAADLVISRAGATSLAEITVMEKPSILIPFPFAADDHQTKNAEAMVNHFASVLIKDGELGSSLDQTVIELMNNLDRLNQMSEAAKSLGKKSSAEHIADQISKLIVESKLL